MQKVFEYIESNRMIRANDKVIVGVSGGADSICLLFVLMEYQKRMPFSLAAVHVEHGVRGEESLEDARFVKEICGRFDIPLRCFSYKVPELARQRKISVEEAGRAARYEAFERTAREMGKAKIAVAHNQNDQAETMLWNMARGSGLLGAGGIRPVRDRIIRPLLCLNRSEIEAYLKERKIAWRNDSTNEELDYTRNSIRHHILPVMECELNPKTVEHMGALAEDIRRVEQYLDGQAGIAEKKAVIYEDGCAKVDVEKFLREEELIQGLVLRKCLNRAGCGLKDVTRYHLEQMQRLFKLQSGRRLILPGGWKAVRNFSEVHIMKDCPAYTSREIHYSEKLQIPGVLKCPLGILEISVLEYKKNIRHNTLPFDKNNEIVTQKMYTEWLDYDKIKGDIYLRTRQPGDYLIINRQGGRKKLKEYLIEEKIPAGKRDEVLVIASGSEILWVVGHRISEAYKISGDTEKVLRVQMKEEK